MSPFPVYIEGTLRGHECLFFGVGPRLEYGLWQPTIINGPLSATSYCFIFASNYLAYPMDLLCLKDGMLP